MYSKECSDRNTIVRAVIAVIRHRCNFCAHFRRARGRAQSVDRRSSPAGAAAPRRPSAGCHLSRSSRRRCPIAAVDSHGRLPLAGPATADHRRFDGHAAAAAEGGSATTSSTTAAAAAAAGLRRRLAGAGGPPGVRPGQTGCCWQLPVIPRLPAQAAHGARHISSY